MSGHSKWATNFRQKSAQDAKRGAAFTKLANLITVAARESGGDPESNFKLRLAVDKARGANMPKDNIERAIKKGTGAGKDGAAFEEITYEIIGPHGTGFIAEAVTDNKNRTVADLKSILNKHNAQLGSSNSVAWNFNRVGLIILENNKLDDDSELSIIDAGAEDIIKDDDVWQVTTLPEKLMALNNDLKRAGFIIKEASLSYLPKEEVTITDSEAQEKIEKLYNLIDDMGDVSNVYTNANW
jgi:YebC/PmpR family DNA-binding regulatory protein